jgi:hypothetical protein
MMAGVFLPVETPMIGTFSGSTCPVSQPESRTNLPLIDPILSRLIAMVNTRSCGEGEQKRLNRIRLTGAYGSLPSLSKTLLRCVDLALLHP